jgi:hypothetical protein
MAAKKKKYYQTRKAKLRAKLKQARWKSSWKRKLAEKDWNVLTINTFIRLALDVAKEHYDMFVIKNPEALTNKMLQSGIVQADYYANTYIKSKKPLVLQMLLTKEQVDGLKEKMDRFHFNKIHLLINQYQGVEVRDADVRANVKGFIEEPGFVEEPGHILENDL